MRACVPTLSVCKPTHGGINWIPQMIYESLEEQHSDDTYGCNA